MQKGLLRVEADGEAVVLSRPNRFVVELEIDGVRDFAHLRDPGRLRELIYPGNRVLVKRAEGSGRKTSWDVLAADSPAGWVFVNSGYHRRLGELIIEGGFLPYTVKRYSAEVKRGKSRLDYLLELDGGRMWVELKGCTLVKDGVALFPDAPTSRGARHVLELAEAVEDGDRALLLVLVFREDALRFLPNAETDPDFAAAYWNALRAGVEVLPILIGYNSIWLTFEGFLPAGVAL